MSTGGKTLVWGTANPEGMAPDYNGLYLTSLDINSMIRQIEDARMSGQRVPVLVEHKGVEIGNVVSAWDHAGTMQCVLELDTSVLEGALGAEFVKSGVCRDLSLGYTVDVTHSKDKKIEMKKKNLKEISLVKKGARNKCHIHGYGPSGRGLSMNEEHLMRVLRGLQAKMSGLERRQSGRDTLDHFAARCPLGMRLGGLTPEKKDPGYKAKDPDSLAEYKKKLKVGEAGFYIPLDTMSMIWMYNDYLTVVFGKFIGFVFRADNVPYLTVFEEALIVGTLMSRYGVSSLLDVFAGVGGDAIADIYKMKLQVAILNQANEAGMSLQTQTADMLKHNVENFLEACPACKPARLEFTRHDSRDLFRHLDIKQFDMMYLDPPWTDPEVALVTPKGKRVKEMSPDEMVIWLKKNVFVPMDESAVFAQYIVLKLRYPPDDLHAPLKEHLGHLVVTQSVRMTPFRVDTGSRGHHYMYFLTNDTIKETTWQRSDVFKKIYAKGEKRRAPMDVEQLKNMHKSEFMNPAEALPRDDNDVLFGVIRDKGGHKYIAPSSRGSSRRSSRASSPGKGRPGADSNEASLFPTMSLLAPCLERA